MSVHENEWESLAAAWGLAGDAVDPLVLKKMVAAHRRRQMAVAVTEGLLVVGFSWLSAIVIADGVESWEAVWLATLWGFTVVAGAFAWWNRRGTWRVLGESVNEFVRVTRLRAERQMRSVFFAAGLFVAEAVVIVAELAWLGRLTFFAGALLAVSGAGVATWGWATKKSVARKLTALSEYDAPERAA